MTIALVLGSYVAKQRGTYDHKTGRLSGPGGYIRSGRTHAAALSNCLAVIEADKRGLLDDTERLAQRFA